METTSIAELEDSPVVGSKSETGELALIASDFQQRIESHRSVPTMLMVDYPANGAIREISGLIFIGIPFITRPAIPRVRALLFERARS